jgi:membrane protease YdiL (CAAX protease family)
VWNTARKEQNVSFLTWPKRYPLVTFFSLAYALSWLPSLFEAYSILPLGPLFAALIMLALIGGRSGVVDFLRRIGQWRVGLRWYALALLMPVALTSTAVGLNLLLGAQMLPIDRMPSVSELPATFLFIGLFIGLGEEPAWRGYALPRLMVGRTTLAASLLLGALHALWHLPLFGLEFDWQNGPPWFLGVLAAAIVTAWMFNHTRGSLLMPILLHTSVNVAAKYFFSPLFGGADLVRLFWIWGGLWCVVALAIVAVNGVELGRTGGPESQVVQRANQRLNA